MTKEHVEDGRETFERIGRACDALGSAGFPALQAAIVGYSRERRGRVQASSWPGEVARSLIRLADELEQVLAQLARQENP
jgi:DNA-binding MurR/RpiR family transcriptional regulator